MKRTALALALLGAIPALAHAQVATSPKISPRLSQAKSAGEVPVLIILRAPPMAAVVPALDRVQRIGDAYDRARRRARTAEAGVRAELDRRGLAYRAFDNVPVVAARVPNALIAKLAARDDVAMITTDPAIRTQLARKDVGPLPQAKAVTDGVTAIGAPAVWAQGHAGEGIVIGGNDTGFEARHLALRNAYRGFNPTYLTYSHSYNWHDGVGGPVGSNDANPCGYATTTPCDDDGHGTHTMGTMVGADGVHEIGVAPGAKWIGCRNMDRGNGTPSTYLDCFEWFLAPTDRYGADPRPDLAPHVVNNSWACPPSEGCDPEHVALLREATMLLESAGIVVVAAAGNGGSSCDTIDDPPATFANTLAVAATASNGSIASFSSRGPGIDLGLSILKPDISAPGVAVSSSVSDDLDGDRKFDDYGTLSGTSMASPHVAGAVALLLSAVPELVGQPALIRQMLVASASPRTFAQNCGGYDGNLVPNAVYGGGFLDVPAAVARASMEFVFRAGFE